MWAMQLPQSLPAKLFLLCYLPNKELLGGGTALPPALRAAALTELYLSGHLAVDERGQATPRGSVDDPVLASVLADVAQQPSRSLDRYIRANQRELHRQLRAQLVTAGVIRTEERRILGIFRQTKIIMINPLVPSRLREEFAATLREDVPATRVEPRAAALVALVAAAELGVVLGRNDRRAARDRIQQLSERSGPVIAALKRVIAAMRAAAAASG